MLTESPSMDKTGEGRSQMGQAAVPLGPSQGQAEQPQAGGKEEKGKDE